MNRFVMLVAGAAMSMFAMGASASDMAGTAAATFKLYDGSNGICSTTFMKNDKDGALFLTAAHCVDGSDELNVREQVLDKDLKTVLSERVYYVKPVKNLTRKDITLLQVRDKNATFDVQPIDIATVAEAATLKIGDPLMAVGYPAAEALAITKGEYTGLVPSMFPGQLDATMYQTTVPVAGGNSGGALYANFDGEWKLIGTTTAKRTDNDIMTYFQTAETVAEVLRGYVVTGSKDAPVVTPAAPTGGIDER